MKQQSDMSSNVCSNRPEPCAAINAFTEWDMHPSHSLSLYTYNRPPSTLSVNAPRWRWWMQCQIDLTNYNTPKTRKWIGIVQIMAVVVVAIPMCAFSFHSCLFPSLSPPPLIWFSFLVALVVYTHTHTLTFDVVQSSIQRIEERNIHVSVCVCVCVCIMMAL